MKGNELRKRKTAGLSPRRSVVRDGRLRDQPKRRSTAWSAWAESDNAVVESCWRV
jgi:hypothetical protein